MNIITEIEKFQDKHLGIFSFAAFLILPGFATIFIFDKSLFLELDFLKLILLSTCYTISFSLVSIFLLLFITISDGKPTGLGDYELTAFTALSVFWTSISTILGIGVGIAINHSIKWHLITTGILAVAFPFLILILGIYSEVRDRRKKLNKTNESDNAQSINPTI